GEHPDRGRPRPAAHVPAPGRPRRRRLTSASAASRCPARQIPSRVVLVVDVVDVVVVVVCSVVVGGTVVVGAGSASPTTNRTVELRSTCVPPAGSCSITRP